jgi:PAS domain S-box-containing protein
MVTVTKKKDRAEELAGDKYFSLIEHAADGIAIVQDGVFKLVNTALSGICGYDKEELLGMPFARLLTPDSQKLTMERYQARIDGKKVPAVYEIQAVTKNGQIRDIEINAALTEYEGRPADEVIIRDITERKKAEQALADEATQRRILVDQSRDGIVVLDQNGKVYEANRQFAEMLGYTPEETANLNVWDWEYLYPHERVLEMIRTVDEAGDHFETQHRRKDGSVYDVEISTNGAVVAGQKLIFCVCRDITERKRAEEALRESEERYRAVIEGAHDMIQSVALDGSINFVNQAWLDTLGYTKADLPKLNLFNIIHPDCLPNCQELFARVVKGEPANDIQAAFLTKDGRKILVEGSAAPRYSGDKVVATQGIFHDVTERNRTEQLQQSENYVLTLLGQGANLSELLDAIVRLGEQSDPSIKGSVLLFEPSKSTELLFLASSPSLPEDYSALFEHGIPIGAKAGSCGTAAYRKERVVIPDIAKSPLFKSFEEVVKQAVNNNLLAVWSQPIIASDGGLLGTIANYSNKVGKPSADNLTMLEWSARIAAIAIERRRAEEALRESEEFRSSLLANSPNPIGVINPDSSIRYVNPALEKLTGFSAAELIGKKAPYPFWMQETLKTTTLNFRRAMRRGDRRTEELFQKKNGERFWVKINSMPVMNDGEFKYLLTNWVDITERKQVEEALQQSEKKYKNLAEATSDMIWEADENGIFTFVSPRIKGLLGYEAKELIGKKKALDLAPKAEARKWLKRFKEVSAKKEPFFGFEITHLHKNGTPVLFEISGIPTFDSDGNFRGYVGINKNITERKLMEEQLMLTDRLASIGELASGIAHELNNPLTSVIGFSQLLLEEDIPQNLKEDLGTIYSEAQRASGIVKNLLTFARKHTPLRQLSQINNILEDVLKLRAYEHRVNNIELVKHFAADLPEIMVDYFQMQQVFLNIIVNAESAMLEANGRGKLVITTSRHNNTVSVAVTDNGPGIAKKDLRRVFDPFFTTKEVGKGTGLGLSICHGIVSGHGGNIYVESTVHKGATFVVELPVNGNPEVRRDSHVKG